MRSSHYVTVPSPPDASVPPDASDPRVMRRITFNAATSTMSSGYGGSVCANAQACAANAIDGDITNLVHTQTASTTQYIWGMWDTGSPLTSIDRVFFSGRNAFGAGYPLWHREINTEVDVTNESKCSVCLLAYVVYAVWFFMHCSCHPS